MAESAGAGPEAGRLYDCYDDGKLRWDRHYIVRILGPVRLADLPAGRRREAEEDIEGCYWLFASVRNQDVLWDSEVMAPGGTEPLRGRPHELFAKSRDGGWFGGVTVASGGVHAARSRGGQGS